MNLAPTSTSFFDNKLAKTAGYFAGYVMLGLAAAVVGPTLPDLAQNTQTQLSQISALFSARSLGYLVGSLQGGHMFDRLPGHLVMGAALILTALMLFSAPLVPMLWLLVLVMFLMGMGESLMDVGGNTLLVWLHGHNVNPYMSALHFFFGFGAFFAPVIVAWATLHSGGITWAYWIMALLILPVAFWLLYLPSPAIRRTSTEASSSARRANWLVVALISLFLFLYVGAESSFGGWIYTYTVALDVTTKTAAAYLTSAFWGALTVGRLLSIPLAVKVRPRYIIGAALAGSLLSVAVLLIGANSITAIWVGTLGIGLAMAPVFPVTLTLAERRLTLTGQITGWFFVGASVGGMTLPWLIGQFFEKSGPVITILMIGADLLLAVAVFITMLAYSKPEQN